MAALPPGPRILVVRLGAMGDVIHTLPAVASLRTSFPNCRISWLIEPRWAPLLEANPSLDDVLLLDRASGRGLLESIEGLRRCRFDLAIDFQGLMKSAVAAWLAKSKRLIGFHRSQIRESAAALLYSDQARSTSCHVVERYLDLAAYAGARERLLMFPLPQGIPEGELPTEPFVLASPLAGWKGKQWPLDRYTELARLLARELELTLVLNGPPESATLLSRVNGVRVHVSGLGGLIHATRKATAVVGLDSGPMHLAAALGVPGVAIFGPTDPARNGPPGESVSVLRSSQAVTTYKRRGEIDPSIARIQAEDVVLELKRKLAAARKPLVNN